MVTTCTIKLEDIACLWRNDKVTKPQRTHADTDAGNYHLVLPLSEQYEIEMFPGTHLIIDRMKGGQDRNRVTRKEKKVLHLKRGQLLICCSNIAHCGGRSSGNPVSGGFQSDIDIAWFTGKNKGAKITDISNHVGL